MALSPKRLAFCREYIANGGNATKAYRDAGYSPKGASQSAEKLLRNTEVKADIAARRARQVAVAEVTVHEVVEGLRAHAERGSTRALELLGKHIGMWTEHQESADSWNALTIELSTRGPAGEA